MPPWWRIPAALLRLIYVLGRDLLEGQLNLRAMSLVYTTLLSLVPLIALSFSVLKGFGVHNQIEPMLYRFLSPLGEQGRELGLRIIQFVENMKVGVLGSIGLALLIYTVVSLIHKIESAFNYIWHISGTRGFVQRFSDYLSVLLVGPVLVFAAIGITASAMSTALMHRLLAIEPLGTLFVSLSKLVPLMLVIGAFTFVYVFVPNTRVRLGAALAGGIVGGLLWQLSGWAFASFVVDSTNYTAIYSSFAILIMFLIWLYLSWLILLIGAALSFYLQHPEHIRRDRDGHPLSARERERLALLSAVVIAREYRADRPPWTVDALAEHCRAPAEALAEVLDALQRARILLPTCAQESPGYVPARAPDTITAAQVLQAVRCHGSVVPAGLVERAEDTLAERLLADAERRAQTQLAQLSLRDLAAELLLQSPPGALRAPQEAAAPGASGESADADLELPIRPEHA